MKIFLLAVLVLTITPRAHADLIGLNLLNDGNFEQAGISQGVTGASQFAIANIQTGSNPIVGWQTTASDQLMEVWKSGFFGVPAATNSTYFAELNATKNATLFQVVQLNINEPVSFSLAHRGRLPDAPGVDTMDLNIYDLGAATSWAVGQGTQVYSQRFVTGPSTWGYYGANNIFTPTVGNYYALTFVSVSAGGGFEGAGNFLDNVAFGYGVGPAAVPEPGTWAAAALLIGGAAFVRSRRRAKIS